MALFHAMLLRKMISSIGGQSAAASGRPSALHWWRLGRCQIFEG